MAPWIRYQIFLPILLLLFINLFWTFLIMRILYRRVPSLLHSFPVLRPRIRGRECRLIIRIEPSLDKI